MKSDVPPLSTDLSTLVVLAYICPEMYLFKYFWKVLTMDEDPSVAPATLASSSPIYLMRDSGSR